MAVAALSAETLSCPLSFSIPEALSQPETFAGFLGENHVREDCPFHRSAEGTRKRACACTDFWRLTSVSARCGARCFISTVFLKIE